MNRFVLCEDLANGCTDLLLVRDIGVERLKLGCGSSSLFFRYAIDRDDDCAASRKQPRGFQPYPFDAPVTRTTLPSKRCECELLEPPVNEDNLDFFVIIASYAMKFVIPRPGVFNRRPPQWVIPVLGQNISAVGALGEQR